MSLEGDVIGYKIDSCWSLSPEERDFKVHPLEDAKPEGHLAKNLLWCFNECNFNSETGGFDKSWFSTKTEGVIISVQDVSENNFGKELLRYKIVKTNGKYEVEN